MSIFVSIILIAIFSSVPLLLWSYGSIFLSEHIWNRARFFAGILGGSISVACIYFFRSGLENSGQVQIFTIISIFLILGGITWGIIEMGSPYIRGFLRKILSLHIALFCLILLFWGWFHERIGLSFSSLSFFTGISGFFLAAFLEEGVKHVSSMSLTARDFRFSRIDFLLYTFFVTLGFVFAENILYLVNAVKSGTLTVFMTGVYRILFSLPLHVFTASICVMLWWKALSYKVFSWRYISLFVTGYLLAISIHSLYNNLIFRKDFLILLLCASIAYICFTQWILPSEEDTLHRKKSK